MEEGWGRKGEEGGRKIEERRERRCNRKERRGRRKEGEEKREKARGAIEAFERRCHPPQLHVDATREHQALIGMEKN